MRWPGASVGTMNAVMPFASPGWPDVRANTRLPCARATWLFDHGVDFLKLMGTGAVLAIGTEPGEPELTEAEMRAAINSMDSHSDEIFAALELSGAKRAECFEQVDDKQFVICH